MFKSCLSLLALCLGCYLTAAAQTDLKPTQFAVPAEVLAGFEAYEIISLDQSAAFSKYTGGGDAIELNFSTSTGTLSFELNRFDQRGSNHHLFARGGAKAGKMIPRQPAAQYLGRERSALGGRAVFTLDEKFILGSWKYDGQKFHLEPLFRLWPAAPRNAYILYRAEDVKPIVDACSIATPPGARVDRAAPDDKAVGECFEVEIALAADFELFQVFGSATSVENFMLGVLADVQTNYDDEFEDEIQFIVSATDIATTNAEDPWSNSTDVDDLLNSFANVSNNGRFSANYDVASLWSNRNFDGPTIGYATVRALCSFGRYNILQNYTTSANALRVLWAHELGHNFGSFHDDAGDGFNFIMAPSVNSASEWSAQSITAITAHYQEVNCLTNCVPPNPPQAALSAPDNNICAGSQVAFFNETTGRVNETNWSFPGGSPASSDDDHPIVSYASPGNYTASMTVTNQFGSSTESITVTVNEASAASRFVVFYDNFEEGARFIEVVNPDDNVTWGLGTVPGTKGDVVAFIDNFNNNERGQSDLLQTPVLNLNGLTSPRFEMEYAYRRYDASFNDQLNVLISIDGGPAEVLFEGQENGSLNFGTQPDEQAAFIPDGPEDWCGLTSSQGCISLDLSDYLNEENVVISIENINGYGNFMFVDNVTVFGNCSSIFPVEWLDFTAHTVGKSAHLNWAVNQDAANAGFFVERATVGTSNWQEIGWVAATGQEASRVAYDFIDENPGTENTYFYRLRQRDYNGTESLSEVRTVSFPIIKGTSVWPNPTNGIVDLRTDTETGDFKLFNALGQSVLSGQLLAGRAELNLRAFPTGVYLLQIGTGVEQEVVRIVRE